MSRKCLRKLGKGVYTSRFEDVLFEDRFLEWGLYRKYVYVESEAFIQIPEGINRVKGIVVQ
jgi:hypothetical protein